MKTTSHKAACRRRVAVEVRVAQHRTFKKANRLIEEWSGRAPGTDGLLAWRLDDKVSAEELAEMYCVAELGYTIPEIDALLRGERWAWEI